MKVVAEAQRSGKWWAIEITAPSGQVYHSQTHRLDEVEAWVKDATALMFEIPEDAVEVEVIVVPLEDQVLSQR